MSMKTDRATVIERANAAYFPADTRDLLLALLAEKEAADGVLEAVYVTAEKHAIALADARTKLAVAEAARDVSQVDAERYRWLRAEATRAGHNIAVNVTFNIGHDWIQYYVRDQFDNAIDAARKETGK